MSFWKFIFLLNKNALDTIGSHLSINTMIKLDSIILIQKDVKYGI